MLTRKSSRVTRSSWKKHISNEVAILLELAEKYALINLKEFLINVGFMGFLAFLVAAILKAAILKDPWAISRAGTKEKPAKVGPTKIERADLCRVFTLQRPD